MTDIPARTLAEAVETAYADSLKHWRSKYAPQIPLRDLLAEVVTGVDIDLKIRPAGRSWIMVSVEARRRFDSETFFYRIQRHQEKASPQEDAPNPLS